MSEKTYDKYETLINEFIEQRNEIKKMICDLEVIKSNIDTLFPKSIDRRYVKFFEEKVKTMTELFRVILDMRKEIIKNTKDELELRNKLFNDDDDDMNIEDVFNIKKIADRVEKLRKGKLLLEEKTKEIAEDAVEKTSENLETIENTKEKGENI